MTGTKYGCGMAMCGACTVSIGASPCAPARRRSRDQQGAEITTIEGLETKEAQAVQAAWVELDVPQCGYCQSGQIMAAAALLAKNRNATDTDIDQAMAGNLCRCATYPRIRAAIKEAAEPLAVRKTTMTRSTSKTLRRRGFLKAGADRRRAGARRPRARARAVERGRRRPAGAPCGAQRLRAHRHRQHGDGDQSSTWRWARGPTPGSPTIVAEELDAGWGQVRAEGAPADAKRYNNLFWGPRRGPAAAPPWPTPGSSCARPGPRPARCSCRPAAQRWNVPADDAGREGRRWSRTPHGAQGELRRARRDGRALAGARRGQAQGPEGLATSSASTCRGRTRRAKSDGTAHVHAGRPAARDADGRRRAPAAASGRRSSHSTPPASKAVPGVRQVVGMPTGVAVLATTSGPRSRRATPCRIQWDESGAFKASLRRDPRRVPSPGREAGRRRPQGRRGGQGASRGRRR